MRGAPSASADPRIRAALDAIYRLFFASRLRVIEGVRAASASHFSKARSGSALLAPQRLQNQALPREIQAAAEPSL